MNPINIIFTPPLPTDPPAVFDAKAQSVGVNLNPWAQQVNALAVDMQQEAGQAVGNAQQAASNAAASALAARDSADDALNWAAVADANAALAAQAANANATVWETGAAYERNQVVWGAPSTGQLFRCIADHAGVSTPPWNDPAHWVQVGASASQDPTAGPTSVVLQRDGSGQLTGYTFTQDGANGTVTLTRDGNGLVSQAVTVFNGTTRTETMNRDPSGTLISVTAVVA